MTRRIERVNSVIRKELSELLQRQVKDPRLSCFVTVTQVNTAPDLSHARIYVSCLGNEEERNEVMKGMAAASGFFRNELAKRLDLRRVPEFSFRWDDSIERADRILKLIDEVSTGDNK